MKSTERKGRKLSKRKEMPQKRKLHIAILISALTIVTTSPYQIRTEQIPLPETVSEQKTEKTSLPKAIPEQSDDKQDVWLTIFVHGSITHMIRQFNLRTIIGVAKDEIEGTLYEKATLHMRHNPFFRRDQAMQDLGLQKIDKDNIAPGKASTALANLFDLVNLWTSGRKSENNHYYTFGWHALVSEKLRHQAAKKLYAELTQEIQKFIKQGINPKVRIIGYSHGGNVILNLANVYEEIPAAKQLSVDELILFGTPLHYKMDRQICCPMFKKVYNIYSYRDRVQRLDLAAPGLLSKRTFTAKRGFKLPDNLTQIRIKMMRNRTTKRRWEKSRDPRRNYKNVRILQGTSNLFRTASPGHIEMWFFKWAVRGYRDKFSLNPMPTVAILPLILNAVEEYGMQDKKNYIIDLRPDQGTLLVKSGEFHAIAPMLTRKQFEELKTVARICQVSQHPHLEYDDQLRMAIMWARQERKLLNLGKSARRKRGGKRSRKKDSLILSQSIPQV